MLYNIICYNVITYNMLYSGKSDAWPEGSLLPSPSSRACHLLQAEAQQTEPPGPVVQQLPLPSQKNRRRLQSGFPLRLRSIQRLLLELLSYQEAGTPRVLGKDF